MANARAAEPIPPSAVLPASPRTAIEAAITANPPTTSGPLRPRSARRPAFGATRAVAAGESARQQPAVNTFHPNWSTMRAGRRSQVANIAPFDVRASTLAAMKSL